MSNFPMEMSDCSWQHQKYARPETYAVFLCPTVGGIFSKILESYLKFLFYHPCKAIEVSYEKLFYSVMFAIQIKRYRILGYFVKFGFFSCNGFRETMLGHGRQTYTGRRLIKFLEYMHFVAPIIFASNCG